MQKKELLKLLDRELLDKLYGFCYSRTRNSYEAEELCSDVVFALVKNARTDGEIGNAYAYIWKTARNVYARHAEGRRAEAEWMVEDSERVLELLTAQEPEEDVREEFFAVCRGIAFLTRAYREVMIAYYLDGKPVSAIAAEQKTEENTIRQRLFSARRQIREQIEGERMKDGSSQTPIISKKGLVNQMEQTKQSGMEPIEKPVPFEDVEYALVGTGQPGWGDPRFTMERKLDRHIFRLCMEKPMTAREIAKALNVPTMYIEDELQMLVAGANGEYGCLRMTENGRAAVNIVVFDEETARRAWGLFIDRMPLIAEIVNDYLEKNKDRYLAFPYLNRKPEWNLILWQQIPILSRCLGWLVTEAVGRRFAGYKAPDRPFSLYGYVSFMDGAWGCGWDYCYQRDVWGYSMIRADNIYDSRIGRHFSINSNLASDGAVRLAVKALDGLDVGSLSEQEKEEAAKAIGEGYLYREGDTLYTKILVSGLDEEDPFAISNGLRDERLNEQAELIADDLEKLIREKMPEYLWNEWRFAASVAGLPAEDLLESALIEKGILRAPETTPGAEGVWLQLKK